MCSFSVAKFDHIPELAKTLKKNGKLIMDPVSLNVSCSDFFGGPEDFIRSVDDFGHVDVCSYALRD